MCSKIFVRYIRLSQRFARFFALHGWAQLLRPLRRSVQRSCSRKERVSVVLGSTSPTETTKSAAVSWLVFVAVRLMRVRHEWVFWNSLWAHSDGRQVIFSVKRNIHFGGWPPEHIWHSNHNVVLFFPIHLSFLRMYCSSRGETLMFSVVSQLTSACLPCSLPTFTTSLFFHAACFTPLLFPFASKSHCAPQQPNKKLLLTFFQTEVHKYLKTSLRTASLFQKLLQLRICSATGVKTTH